MHAATDWIADLPAGNPAAGSAAGFTADLNTDSTAGLALGLVRPISDAVHPASRQRKGAPITRPRVAIVHYWWLSNRGGEAVVKALLGLYPEADLYLHVSNEDLVRQALGPGFKGQIHHTFIARLPIARRLYQTYLPLMPMALEGLDLTAYDLIISSESGPAKGVITRPDAVHICYCHSPMRYLWDMYHEYYRAAKWLTRTMLPFMASRMRLWDRVSADRVDHFVANSSFIASRIRKYYHRDSTVIYPPVDTHKFDPSRQRKAYYLMLGQLVPYKRPDLAVEVFNKMGLPLVVIGEGPMLKQLRRMAKPNVRVLGRQPFELVKAYLEQCRALVFPGQEDFGIVPIEAMAAGAPVVAFNRGGACESVIDARTGIFFDEQTVESLEEALIEMEARASTFNPHAIAQHAARFNVAKFKSEMLRLIEARLSRG